MRVAGDRDARLDELARMGLSRAQLLVAEAIGFDNFMLAWRIYDQDSACRTDKGDLEVRMRSYRSYLRFQRNRFIEALNATGKSVNEIRRIVNIELGEKLSARHISHIARGK